MPSPRVFRRIGWGTGRRRGRGLRRRGWEGTGYAEDRMVAFPGEVGSLADPAMVFCCAAIGRSDEGRRRRKARCLRGCGRCQDCGWRCLRSRKRRRGRSRPGGSGEVFVDDR